MHSVRYFRSFSELPDGYRALLTQAEAQRGLFAHPDWFGFLMAHYYSPDQELRLYGVESAAGEPLLLAPLRLSRVDPAVPGARLIGAVSHPENFTAIALIFAAAVADPVAVLTCLFTALRQGTADGQGLPADALRLWPLEPGTPLDRDLQLALRRAGFLIQDYANSYNRYEDTAGLSYQDYFARRSANLRYSVRRRQRALERLGQMELAVHGAGESLAAALNDYMAVTVNSWKQPGTMIAPSTLALIDLAARHDCLRLGVLRLDGTPAAAQFWLVTGGVAHCARLAYQERFRKLAVGVVLTNFMIAQVLDRDRVRAIDFGYGTEDYKGGWMHQARDYHGLMAFNPSTRPGLFQGALHLLGRPVKRALRRGLDRLRGRGTPPAPGV
jgi:hypothetical protein